MHKADNYHIAGLSTSLFIIVSHKLILRKVLIEILFLGLVFFYITKAIFDIFDHFENFKHGTVFLIIYTLGLLHTPAHDAFSSIYARLLFELYALTVKILLAYKVSDTEPLVFHSCVVVIICAFMVREETLRRKTARLLKNTTSNLENLLVFIKNHMPSPFIILSKPLDSCLFLTEGYRKAFGIHDDASILRSLLRIRPQIHRTFSDKFQPMSTCRRPHLKNFIEDNKVPLSKGVLLEARSLFGEMLNKTPYRTKISQISWNGEEAYAILLQNLSYQEDFEAARLLCQSQEKAISTVAHELRNPVNGLLGIVSLIERETKDLKQLHSLSILKTNISLLLNIVNTILDIQQIRANKLTLNVSEFDLSSVVSNIGLLFEFQFMTKKLQFKVDLDPSLPKLQTDKNRLSQILINLTANALKFTLEGSITISAHMCKQDPNKVLFKVSDTGIGIKPEDCNKLFQMFGKLQSSSSLNQEGVGLGLMISNSLVKELNKNEPDAHIQVESEYGKGTTFSFVIYADYNKGSRVSINDVHEDDSSPSPHTSMMESRDFLQVPQFWEQRRSSASSRESTKSLMYEFRKYESILIEDQKAILIVDDNIFNLMGAKSILSKNELACYISQNGKEAVEKVQFLKSHQIDLEVILMDLDMPVMNGFEATKLLLELMEKGEISKTPIIGLSGESSAETREKCLAAGMKELITKPLREEDVNRLIECYIKKG